MDSFEFVFEDICAPSILDDHPSEFPQLNNNQDGFTTEDSGDNQPQDDYSDLFQVVTNDIGNGFETAQTDERWNNDCAQAIHFMRTIIKTFAHVAHVDDFTLESNGRYSAKSKAKKYLIIFPWCLNPTPQKKVRQTLKQDEALGPTIGVVVSCINFFISQGPSFSIEQLNFLRDYYVTKSPRPEPATCFTSIVELYHAFQVRFAPLSRASAPDTLGTLTTEMEQLRVQVDQNTHNIGELSHHHNLLLHHLNRISNASTASSATSPAASSLEEPPRKRKAGDQSGDRASYFRIRTADLKTKHLWCVPGGVFGLYADGVGPLRPVGHCGIVVFSTCPDVEEPHPDPDHPDLYVRVVMVC
jgi:hypothetical protein